MDGSGSTLEHLGAGDSFLYYNLLDHEEGEELFGELLASDIWQSFEHRGGPVPRLVSIQADLTSDGDQPIYRHPTDTYLAAEPMSVHVRRSDI